MSNGKYNIELFSELNTLNIKLKNYSIEFEIEDKFKLKPGFTILKGDNGVGKTQLLKAIIGYNKLNGKEIQHKINGEKITVETPLDAIRKGIRAFFQSDILFNSLTLPEVVYLYGEGIGREIDFEKLRKIIGLLGGENFPLDDEVFYRENLASTLSMGQQAIAKIATIFYDFFADELDNLEGEDNFDEVITFPNSNNGIPLYLVILDEVFASLSYTNKMRMLKFFRALYKKSGEKLSFLIVTHNPEEIVLWKPNDIYEISVKDPNESKSKGSWSNYPVRIIKEVNKNSTYFVPNFLNIEDPIPVYEHEAQENTGGKENFWNYFGRLKDCIKEVLKDIKEEEEKDIKKRSGLFKKLGINKISEKPVYVIDKSLTETGRPNIENDKVVIWEGGEGIKHFDRCKELIETLAKKIEKPSIPVVVIGGGSILNAVGFVCSIINRGINPLIYVPTTILSASDVAIGSKTSCNLDYKHKIGTYHNPDAIVLDMYFIEKQFSISPERFILNTAENYKHFLLQDETRLKALKEFITSQKFNKDLIKKFINQTMFLKSEIMISDFYETNIGKLLLYGHAWARLLETASDFSLPHDCAVWIGMYMDMYLSLGEKEEEKQKQEQGKGNISQELEFIKENIFPLIAGYYSNAINKILEKDLAELARKDVKGSFEPSENGGIKYKYIRLKEVGQYKVLKQSKDIFGEQEFYDDSSNNFVIKRSNNNFGEKKRDSYKFFNRFVKDILMEILACGNNNNLNKSC